MKKHQEKNSAALLTATAVLTVATLMHISNKNTNNLQAVDACVHQKASEDSNPLIKNNPGGREAWDMHASACFRLINKK